MISTKEDDVSNHDNKIQSSLVEQATDTLLESPYGIHALVIYSDMIKLREFWTFYANRSIEEKNELLFMAPFYQTVDFVRETLSEGRKSIDVKRCEEEEKSLIIRDSLENYHGKIGDAFDVKSILKANQGLIEDANALNKKGLSFLGDMGAFLFKNQMQSLFDYESSLPIEFDANLKGICLYHQKDFDRLSVNQKEEIIKCHKLAIKI